MLINRRLNQTARRCVEHERMASSTLPGCKLVVVTTYPRLTTLVWLAYEKNEPHDSFSFEIRTLEE